MPEAQWLEYEPLTDDQVLAGAASGVWQARADAADARQGQDHPLSRLPICSRHIPPRCSTPARLPRDGRWSDGTMNRLYVVESGLLDHRCRRRPSLAAASQPDARVGGTTAAGGRTSRGPSRRRCCNSRLTPTSTDSSACVARDLLANRGQSVIAVGPQQPPEVHAAVHRLNALLGNVGQDRALHASGRPDRRPHVEAIAALAAAMQAGSVDTLLILGGNPVYDAPADVDFAGGLTKVPTVDSRGPVSQRNRAALPVARAAGAFPRIVGRRPVV